MSGPPTYPITVQMPVDDEQRNRWLAAAGIVLIKLILLLPHILLLFLFGMMIQILAWIGYWGIAFTDRLPDPIRRLEIIFLAWITRVVAWFAGTTDVYPTFGTDQDVPGDRDRGTGARSRRTVCSPCSGSSSSARSRPCRTSSFCSS